MKNKLLSLNQDQLAGLTLFVLLAASYIYVFPRWADPNQNSRLDMVVAVVDDGTFQIDPYVKNTVDYAKVGEHYYSDKAPGAAFIGIPVYAGMKLFLGLPVVNQFMEKLSSNAAFQATLNPQGTGILEQKIRFALAQTAIAICVSLIPTALLGVLIYFTARRFKMRSWSAFWTAIIYGLLTPVFAYSNGFYGHQLAAALLFGAFYLIFSREQYSVGLLLLIGVLFGYSVVTEYPALLVVGILFLYLFYRLFQQRRYIHIGWAVLGGAVIAAGWMAYNKTVFGGPFNLGYSYSELWVSQHQTGFMSLSIPTWQATWGITFSVFRGLFLLSPIALLFLPGFILWWQSRLYRVELFICVASFSAMFLFNASSIMWWGGFAVGPRYLLPGLPFLILPVGFVIDRWGGKPWFRILALLLSVWSLIATWGLTLAGQAYPPDTLRNPYLEFAWPNWLAGNIARNIGTILGMPGFWSLLPLFAIVLLGGAAWRFVLRSNRYPMVGRKQL